jgi:uncharacterized membrane protein
LFTLPHQFKKVDKQKIKVSYRAYLKRVFQYFLQGLIVLAPIVITIWAIVSLFNAVDGILPNIIHGAFPNWLKKDSEGNIERIPGLGFVVVIVMVIVVGGLSSSYFFGKIVGLLDKLLEHTPGIKFIYGSVKDFFEAFAGNKKKFDKPVLVNVDATDVWRVGFITRADAEDFELIDHVVVYVPHSYAISGITYIVPKERTSYCFRKSKSFRSRNC